MMPIRIGINGIGRVGKQVFRYAYKDPEIEIVHINDNMDLGLLTHLLKYDSIHGKFEHEINRNANYIKVNNNKIFVTNESSPDKIDWDKENVDIVIDSSGLYKTRDLLEKHTYNTNVKKVILSCPADDDSLDKTVVIGINHDEIEAGHTYISNASCTTNCVGIIIKVLQDTFGIEKAFMNTVHPVTNNQKLLDGPHNDYRRARAAVGNIIPTTTSAIKTLPMVMPEMKGIFDGFATRVPVIDGSIVELTAQLKSKTSVENINDTFKNFANSKLKGLLEYCNEPIVSSDIINNKHSAIFDALSTKLIGGDMVQIVAWYDNECGYSARITDLVKILANYL